METEIPRFTSRQGFFCSPSRQNRLSEIPTQRAVQGMGKALLRQAVTAAASWLFTTI
jgi:hypothetical protein